MKVVTLFTRNGCHLCDIAKEIIMELKNDFDFAYEECDIEERDEWTEAYGLMIPVILLDGKEVQYGQIDKTLLYKAFSEK
ncbi:glutaredoxin family protein [Bacillus tuaregi]|uniref:glutaredoxin family protein n=1 Tax=Bacillus tuaregi TaxID=1816695 RepID=UPI0008F9629B|nr:glutaredoxin family protein [Bacillus tuaregi]